MTRIVCISDLHEHLVDIPACDLLLIAGDVSFAFKGDLPSKQAFLAGAFKDWLDRVPANEVVLVAGNHDQSIEKWGLPEGLRCHYLQDEGIELFGLKLWGTPRQPWFHDWAFNAPRRHGEAFLASKFELIPADTDIVVAHGPPRGYGDLTRDEHVGSTAITETLERVRPRLMVCGHIHPAYGRAFVDLGHSDSLAHLRTVLADRILHHGLDDLDAGDIRRRAPRRLTHEISRYLFEHGRDDQGAAVAGGRYVSRLGDDLVNWAILEPNEASDAASEPIDRDDEALRAVFKRFDLRWG